MDTPLVSPPGRLFVVATPLGNLGDITLRAAEVLRTVPVVAAEDTRHTRRLLSHLDAHPRLVSVHAHAEAGRITSVVEELRHGSDVALVTDAGTPVVSDPGASLVRAAREAGVPVIPLPGPSAVATALSVGGLPGDRYTFLGFLPRRGAERERLLERAATEPWTVVCFEAPGRLARLLEDLARVAGPTREVVVARELTKLHEEVLAGPAAELARRYAEVPPRGEITVLVSPAPAHGDPPPDLAAIGQEAGVLLASGLSRREVARRLTESGVLSRNEAYRLVTELP